MRLTAYEGEEKFPRLSPDGKWIAFTAQYEGNDDVYVMSSAGGEPQRLTYHPLPDQALVPEPVEQSGDSRGRELQLGREVDPAHPLISGAGE